MRTSFIQSASAHSARPVYGFVSLWLVGLFFSCFATQFFVICVLALKSAIKKSIPKSIIQETWKIMKNGFQNDPRGSKMTPQCSKMTLRGANMEPKEHNLAQNGVETVRENIEKSMPEKGSAPGRLPPIGGVPLWRLFGRKGRPGDRFWRSFWNHFPSKMRSKIDAEIESQKNMKNHELSMKTRCEKYWKIKSFSSKKNMR